MTGSNIALVFGPTLIGNPPMDPQAMAQGMPLVNRACLFMLDNREDIFGEPEGEGVSEDPSLAPDISYPEEASMS